MKRKLTEGPLVVASHNPDKAAEIAELLAPYEIEVASAAADRHSCRRRPCER